jgi:glycosyltransferase involved in cell wall biosynthesis
MSSNAPLITVAMSVRNVETTIERALRSLISQTYTNWELRLIDDGSTDATRARVAQIEDPRITLITHDRSAGLATRLNEAMAAANGPYIARMDGDDFCYPERFARQVAHLEANPSIDLLGTGAIAFRDSGHPIGKFTQPAAHEDICAKPYLGFPVPHPTWMGRTSWFRRFPYDPTALRAQDQTLLLSAYQSSRFANLPEILFAYSQDIPTPQSISGGRWHTTRALINRARQTNDWALGVRGVTSQATRTLATLAELRLGRGEAILARRFAPLTDAERTRFMTVLGALTLSA